MDNYYALLNVPTTATADAIAAAYRKLALRYHPDRHPQNAAATQIFERATEAFEVLGNPQRRSLYDRQFIPHFSTERSVLAFRAFTGGNSLHSSWPEGHWRRRRNLAALSRLSAVFTTQWPTQGQRHRHKRMVLWGPHCLLPGC